MGKRRVWTALAVAASLVVAVEAAAAGVFIVSRSGVEAYADAKSGFIQVAYSLQLPTFNPKAIDLQGTAADDAALQTLKGQSPQLVYCVGTYAAKKVREALPDVWIIYAMVYYPEVEGFFQDPKMVGIASLGSTKGLSTLVKAFGAKGKSCVILHSPAVGPAVGGLISRLGADGFDAQGRSVGNVADLAAVLGEVKEQTRLVLLLPDPLTANGDALRYIISTCLENRVVPVALSENLVASGALCASFFAPDAVGNEAARVAQAILNGVNIPTDKLVQPAVSASAANKNTADALRLKVPAALRIEVVYE
ncbi:MAG: hypothetical protein AB1347_04740 [Acidobacteriota bacterium]